LGLKPALIVAAAMVVVTTGVFVAVALLPLRSSREEAPQQPVAAKGGDGQSTAEKEVDAGAGREGWDRLVFARRFRLFESGVVFRKKSALALSLGAVAAGVRDRRQREDGPPYHKLEAP